jgi:glycosyltransferase involved in cell wall biosynthesis
MDVLTAGRDALIVPRRDSQALAGRIVELIDAPDRRAELAARARETARHYDIDAFVKKMERLYAILHQHSRATRRHIARAADLSFLTEKAAT